MVVRRILYGFLLTGMIAFHLFYSGAVAWYLLLLTIFFPWFPACSRFLQKVR
jgi:hypothetical protein